jgi:hypothetical protein
MFIAMNRFKVRKGEEPAFETRWRERDTHLHTVPGYVEFHLLKGPERDDHGALCVAHDLAVACRFRGMDPLGSLLSGAPRRRPGPRADDLAPGVRGVRDHPDRRLCGAQRGAIVIRPAHGP